MADQTTIEIRMLGLEDGAALAHLAQLDTADTPAAPLLGGIVEGRLVAAHSLATGRSIADPFRHTAEVRSLLAETGGSAARRTRPRAAQPASGPARRATRTGIRGAPMSGGAMHAGTIGIRTRPATRQRSGWLTTFRARLRDRRRDRAARAHSLRMSGGDMRSIPGSEHTHLLRHRGF